MANGHDDWTAFSPIFVDKRQNIYVIKNYIQFKNSKSCVFNYKVIIKEKKTYIYIQYCIISRAVFKLKYKM